jgi:hypothetical protein
LAWERIEMARGVGHAGSALGPTGSRRIDSIIQASAGGPCSSKLPHRWSGREFRAAMATATISQETGAKDGALMGTTTGWSIKPDLKSVARQWWSESWESEWKHSCIRGDDATIEMTKTCTRASHTTGANARIQRCWQFLSVISPLPLAQFRRGGNSIRISVKAGMPNPQAPQLPRIPWLKTALADFPGDLRDELVQRFRAKVVLVPVADGNGAMGKSFGCEWFNAHLSTVLDSVANAKPFAGMHLDAGRRKLVPQAVDGVGTRAMAKDHPPWSQRMQRGDRAIHAFG